MKLTREEAISVAVKRVVLTTAVVGLFSGARMLHRQLVGAADARQQVAVIDGAGSAIARMVGEGDAAVMRVLVDALACVSPAGRDALTRASAPARVR